MPKTVTTHALFDIVCWSEPPLTPTGKRVSHLARFGEELELPQDEFDRLSALGAVGDLEAATRAAIAVDGGVVWPDEQVDSANAEDLITYMGQNPAQAAHVLERETARAKPRSTVVKACERIQEELDAEVEARLEAERAAADAEQRAYEHSSGAATGGAPTIP